MKMTQEVGGSLDGNYVNDNQDIIVTIIQWDNETNKYRVDHHIVTRNKPKGDKE